MSYIKQDEGGGGDTYTLRAAQSGADVDIQLDAATGSDSDVKLKAGTNITLTEASDTITIDAASGGSPGGSNTQVQFNDGGSFGGDSGLTFNKTTNNLGVGTTPSASEKIFALGDIRGSNLKGSQYRSLNSGTSADPIYTRDGDDDTGIFFAGSNELSMSTNGVERFRVGSAGQLGIAGATYGTSGQVLTSTGPSSPPIWNAAVGGKPFQAFSNVQPDVAYGAVYDTINLLQAPYGLYSNEIANPSSQGQSTPVWTPFVLPKNLTITHLVIRVGATVANAGTTFTVGVYDVDVNGMPSTQLFKSVFPIGPGSPTGDIQVAITNTGGTGALNGGEVYWVGGNYDQTPGSNLQTARMADSAGSTGGLLATNQPFSTVGMNNTGLRDNSATAYSGMPATVTVSSASTWQVFNVDLLAVGAVFA